MCRVDFRFKMSIKTKNLIHFYIVKFFHKCCIDQLLYLVIFKNSAMLIICHDLEDFLKTFFNEPVMFIKSVMSL